MNQTVGLEIVLVALQAVIIPMIGFGIRMQMRSNAELREQSRKHDQTLYGVDGSNGLSSLVRQQGMTIQEHHDTLNELDYRMKNAEDRLGAT